MRPHRHSLHSQHTTYMHIDAYKSCRLPTTSPPSSSRFTDNTATCVRKGRKNRDRCYMSHIVSDGHATGAGVMQAVCQYTSGLPIYVRLSPENIADQVTTIYLVGLGHADQGRVHRASEPTKILLAWLLSWHHGYAPVPSAVVVRHTHQATVLASCYYDQQ